MQPRKHRASGRAAGVTQDHATNAFPLTPAVPDPARGSVGATSTFLGSHQGASSSRVGSCSQFALGTENTSKTITWPAENEHVRQCARPQHPGVHIPQAPQPGRPPSGIHVTSVITPQQQKGTWEGEEQARPQPSDGTPSATAEHRLRAQGGTTRGPAASRSRPRVAPKQNLEMKLNDRVTSENTILGKPGTEKDGMIPRRLLRVVTFRGKKTDCGYQGLGKWEALTRLGTDKTVLRMAVLAQDREGRECRVSSSALQDP